MVFRAMNERGWLMSSGRIYQAIIERGSDRLIVAEVIANDDDQAFEMVSERLKNRGYISLRTMWLESGGVLAGIKSEYYTKNKPPAMASCRGRMKGGETPKQSARLTNQE